MAEYLTMGFSHASDPNLRGELAAFLSERAEVELVVSEAQSYERLAAMLNEGKAQLAWLAPIPYIALSQANVVVPLVYNERAKKHYCSALIVPADSHVKRVVELRGARAAWVDRHSAAGFVVPRIELSKVGVDPRSELSEQTFAGSHERVAALVAERGVDFGATYAHREDDGTISGPWTANPDVTSQVRVVTTFGKIPSDVIAAHNDVPLAVRVKITRALRMMNSDETGRRIARELFDVERFRLLDAEDYASLQRIAREARDQGLLDEPAAP